MTQHQQVFQAIQKLGGYATLREIYENVDASQWRTSDWRASIRRTLQVHQDFLKIKPGLWGINSRRAEFAHLLDNLRAPKEKEKYDHYYYQGLLLQTGNSRGYKTFAPSQDQNKNFLRTTLGKTRSIKALPSFTHKHIVKRASTVDVIWINERDMPHAFFEIEHSTNFTNSLSKYIALQDFRARFYVASEKSKHSQFAKIISRFEYRSLQVKFVGYEEIARWHSIAAEAGRLDIP